MIILCSTNSHSVCNTCIHCTTCCCLATRFCVRDAGLSWDQTPAWSSTWKYLVTIGIGEPAHDHLEGKNENFYRVSGYHTSQLYPAIRTRNPCRRCTYIYIVVYVTWYLRVYCFEEERWLDNFLVKVTSKLPWYSSLQVQVQVSNRKSCLKLPGSTSRPCRVFDDFGNFFDKFCKSWGKFLILKAWSVW